MSVNTKETDPSGTQCLSVYIPLAELTLLYWPGSHIRSRNLQNLLKCGVTMGSFQFPEMISPQCKILQPFQILVICSDVLVHFSRRDDLSSSAFVKIDVLDAASIDRTSNSPMDNDFQLWLKKSLKDIEEPDKPLKEFYKKNPSYQVKHLIDCVCYFHFHIIITIIYIWQTRKTIHEAGNHSTDALQNEMSRGGQEKGAMAEAKPAEEENAPSEGPYQVKVIVIISTTTTYYCHYDYYYNYYYQVEAADSESTKEQSCNNQFGNDLGEYMTFQSSEKENDNPNKNTIDLVAGEDPISTDHSQIQYGTNLDSDVDHFFAIAKNHSQKQRVQSLSGTDLLLKDFQTLQPGEWLCDEIIDMYSNLLMMKLNRPSQFVIFSAQFSGLLSNGGKAYSYDRVSSYLNSKKQPLLQPPLTTFDNIYIPANVRYSHWFLVTLEHQKKQSFDIRLIGIWIL